MIIGMLLMQLLFMLIRLLLLFVSSTSNNIFVMNDILNINNISDDIIACNYYLFHHYCRIGVTVIFIFI